MRLPALAMSGMPDVLMGLVHHVEARGSKSLGQLLRDEIAPCHGVRIAGGAGAGQCRVTAGKSANALVKTLRWLGYARILIGHEKRLASVRPHPGQAPQKSSAARPMPSLRMGEFQSAPDPPRPPGAAAPRPIFAGFP